MRLDIKFKSITYKWFFNIFLVIALAASIAAVAFSSLYSSLYTEKIESLAVDYSDEFSALANVTNKTFTDTAISIAGNFKYKDKIEVQVINKNGKVIVSTTGFSTDVGEMPDYLKAKETKKFQTYKGKIGTKESVMAGTTMLYTQSGEELGAYRWITSMQRLFLFAL